MIKILIFIVSGRWSINLKNIIFLFIIDEADVTKSNLINVTFYVGEFTMNVNVSLHISIPNSFQ